MDILCSSCAVAGQTDDRDEAVCLRCARGNYPNSREECQNYVPLDYQFRALRELSGRRWNSPYAD